MKLTLDKSWELCLKQWRWIAKQIKAGDERNTVALKIAWCEKNGVGYIKAYCFFCEYIINQSPSGCSSCPARKIDKNFRCSQNKYSYYDKPLKFYAKLLELNKKRRKKR